jgi:hypothetical protein
MQRERRYRKIKSAQPQRGQSEDDAEQRADDCRGGKRQPDRGVEFLEEDAGGEGASA